MLEAEFQPLNWRVASGHTEVGGWLLEALPMSAGTGPDSCTGPANADKMDSAILGEEEPFFTAFMVPSKAERLVVELALGRFS